MCPAWSFAKKQKKKKMLMAAQIFPFGTEGIPCSFGKVRAATKPVPVHQVCPGTWEKVHFKDVASQQLPLAFFFFFIKDQWMALQEEDHLAGWSTGH